MKILGLASIIATVNQVVAQETKYYNYSKKGTDWGFKYKKCDGPN